jgi:hypothetical protein
MATSHEEKREQWWWWTYKAERVVVVRRIGRPGWRRAQWRTTGSAAMPSPRETA